MRVCFDETLYSSIQKCVKLSLMLLASLFSASIRIHSLGSNNKFNLNLKLKMIPYLKLEKKKKWRNTDRPHVTLLSSSAFSRRIKLKLCGLIKHFKVALHIQASVIAVLNAKQVNLFLLI